MQFLKRMTLLIVANLLVMLALGIVFSVLVAFVPALRGTGLGQLVVLAGVFGFGGALVSLAFSKQIAKWTSGVQVIDPAGATGEARQLLQLVEHLAGRAGITTMPEVGIYDSPEINAFCTGPSKNSSLVAVSTGLLRRMSRDELEGVLAHELSHAGNGDMVTLTLVNGVVNTLVLLATFIVTNFLESQMRRDDDRGIGGFFLRQLVFNLVHMVVGTLAAFVVVLPFSRWREYRADAGGAALVGKQRMIAALTALQDNFRLPRPALAEAGRDPSMAAMKIGSLRRNALFSTHPSLEDRIERLRTLPA